SGFGHCCHSTYGSSEENSPQRTPRYAEEDAHRFLCVPLRSFAVKTTHATPPETPLPRLRSAHGTPPGGALPALWRRRAPPCAGGTRSRNRDREGGRGHQHHPRHRAVAVRRRMHRRGRRARLRRRGRVGVVVGTAHIRPAVALRPRRLASARTAARALPARW